MKTKFLGVSPTLPCEYTCVVGINMLSHLFCPGAQDAFQRGLYSYRNMSKSYAASNLQIAFPITPLENK